jgi:hypothetical protein
MDVSSAVVPDGIEPLVGYRAWLAVIERHGTTLYSLGGPGSFGGCWDLAVSGWATSACRVDRSRLLRVNRDRASSRASTNEAWGPPHRAPQEGCSCGFYATKDLAPVTFFVHPEIVVGRVDLAGKVIEHDYGYRAQHARIAALIPVPGTERSALKVANRLGIRLEEAPCLADPDAR